MSKLKFYLDENMSAQIADGLRTRDIDVLTTPEAGRLGTTDTDQLAFATAQGRVLVTQDEDFLILARTVVNHAGICYYKSQTRTVKEVLAALFELYDGLTPEYMSDLVRYL